MVDSSFDLLRTLCIAPVRDGSRRADRHLSARDFSSPDELARDLSRGGGARLNAEPGPAAAAQRAVVGSSLALVAAGLALLFGVLHIINFAQGDFFMLGGYAVWFS